MAGTIAIRALRTRAIRPAPLKTFASGDNSLDEPYRLFLPSSVSLRQLRDSLKMPAEKSPAKRRKVAHNAPPRRDKPVEEEQVGQSGSEDQDEESEEESATLDAPSTEETPVAPKTFKELV